eukprot:TRINITY_DN7589_c0_g1_i1.p1 TRINITY_DN7589_c0_g1~~TRINITY_DN7589_c0_g1_i1.p1  ORF type:complete len:147 (+),score=10.43 TRINITY_DN7589_c0_g1_i1:36-443(+)
MSQTETETEEGDIKLFESNMNRIYFRHLHMASAVKYYLCVIGFSVVISLINVTQFPYYEAFSFLSFVCYFTPLLVSCMVLYLFMSYYGEYLSYRNRFVEDANSTLPMYKLMYDHNSQKLWSITSSIRNRMSINRR